ncbi:hypothetical protein GCM10022254_43180 [Actinomadura meridiana]|uniref:Uncharacterized protein n=1 Tax=Actinomadura meridiana TaxID=559626 RepID=A0ABP8C965_9ACTN
MPPLASSQGVVHIVTEQWYRISTSDNLPAVPDLTMRSHGTLDAFEGDVLVNTGTTASVIDITAEDWAAEPPLRVAGGSFAEVTETFVSVGAGRLRVLAASGPEVLALDLGGDAGHRLRLYSRYLTPRHQTHLLRLWPVPAAAPDWDYQIDDDGQPIVRPDRSSTETLTVTMTTEQCNTLSTEVQEMALSEIQNGDIDDIAEDCREIRDIIGYKTEPGGEVPVTLTTRQWKVALATLEHRSHIGEVDDYTRSMLYVLDTIRRQVSDRLPRGRVFGG